jgi:hypothetical protein
MLMTEIMEFVTQSVTTQILISRKRRKLTRSILLIQIDGEDLKQ